MFGSTYFTPGYFTEDYFPGAQAVLPVYCDGPTLGQAIAAVASRLNDPTHIHWSADEIRRYVLEALRTWSVWTTQWRATRDVTIPISAPFVDLGDLYAEVRPATLTNWDLVAMLQEALLEPVAQGGVWTGTAQFSLAQLSDAIERRRDQFLRETGIVQTRHVQVFQTAISTGVYPLPRCTLQVRRVAWAPEATRTLLPLTRTDLFAATTFRPTWPTAVATPRGYATVAQPPTAVQLLPPSSTPGTLDVVYIAAGPDVDPTVEESLGIPDDYVWVIKYGVLADLLNNDALALDAARAAYCEARWQQGVELARRQAVVLNARINQRPVPIGSLADADAYSPTWQLLTGTPQKILLAGQTLLGIWPPAAQATSTLTLDLVRCVPVPVEDEDLIDLPRDLYDTICDIAQHAALFKEGPGQVEQALPLLERAARAAGVALQLQQAAQPARRPLIGQQQQDASTVPYRLPPVPVEVP